jgi:hypothetical protein
MGDFPVADQAITRYPEFWKGCMVQTSSRGARDVAERPQLRCRRESAPQNKRLCRLRQAGTAARPRTYLETNARTLTMAAIEWFVLV